MALAFITKVHVLTLKDGRHFCFPLNSFLLLKREKWTESVAQVVEHLPSSARP
jgi:hypothetical protein